MSAPLILAVESATKVLSVALLRGDELRAEVRGAAGRSAAESLLPAVEALLSRGGAAIADVEAFAVSVGPGSFTSLRIGLATVKGLAFGSALPVAPVSTLAALALAAGEGPDPVLAVLDARRGEVYAAAPGLVEEGVYTPDELAALLPPHCRVVGEGVSVCGETLRARLGPGVALMPPPQGEPAARHVGRLGARILAAGGGEPAGDVVPRYVRRAQAEVARTGERFEPAPSRDGSPSGTSL